MVNGVPDYRFYNPSRGPGAVERRGGRRGLLFAVLVAVAFVVALGVVIGQRLSDQAVAVLAGATCGVGASIPTSLLIAWVTRRRQETRPAQPAQGAYPPVVVVQSPPQVGNPALPQGVYAPPYVQPMPREFTVVGEGMDDGAW